MQAPLVISPQPGPQTEFLASLADIALFGGGAGGGKSYALDLCCAQWAHVSGYGAVVFRRTSPELTGAGSVWETARQIFPHLGGRSRQAPQLEWRFPSGATVEFRHLQHADDVLAHQGKQYATICFDELTHFDESQFWYMVSRLRSTCGVKPHMRATCNPDPDSFVRRLVSWWIDDATGLAIPERTGVLRWFVRVGDELRWYDSREAALADVSGSAPMSFTFIESKLEDNPALTVADPGYRGRLEALSRVDRARLLDRNWNVRAQAGTVFRRSWFRVVDVAPRALRTVRAWDKAATQPSPTNPDPDWTRGARVSLNEGGELCIEHIECLRETPHGVDMAMRRIAEQDGPTVQVAIWQDPGQAGVVDVSHTHTALLGFSLRSVRASLNKLAYASPWSALAEAGKVTLVRGPWTNAFLDEAESFPDGGHDDQVDAVSLAFQVLTGRAIYADGNMPAETVEGMSRYAYALPGSARATLKDNW